jgi:hypothetical protein
LRPLHIQHGPAVVAKHLEWYLQNTEAQFASVTKFAQKFAAYDPDAPGFPGEKDTDYVT